MAKSPIRVAVEAVLAEHDVYIGKDPTITDTSRDPKGAVHSTRVKYPRVKVLTTSVAMQIIRSLALVPEMKGMKYIYVAMSSPKHGDCHGLVVGATNNDAVARRLRTSGPFLTNDVDAVGTVVIRDEACRNLGYMDVEAAKTHFRMASDYKAPDLFVHPLWVQMSSDINQPIEMRTNASFEAKQKQWEEGRAQREADRLQHDAERKLDIAMGELKGKLEGDLKHYGDLYIMLEHANNLLPVGSKVRETIADELDALDVKWQSVGVFPRILIGK